MLEILYELCHSGTMACIYTDYNDVTKFYFGKVIAIDENDIAIQMVSLDGENDGIVVMSVEKVLRIETDSQYVDKMKKLCSKNLTFSFEILEMHNDIKTKLIAYVFKEKHIISIEILDSGYNDVIGIIEEINDNVCIVKQIDEYGYEDGKSIFRINDITKFSFLTQDENRIMRLINFKENQGTVL